jgi:hypothetical protein
MSTTITANATAFEDLSHIEAPREKLQLEASKPSLIGSYVVTEPTPTASVTPPPALSVSRYRPGTIRRF